MVFGLESRECGKNDGGYQLRLFVTRSQYPDFPSQGGSKESPTTTTPAPRKCGISLLRKDYIDLFIIETRIIVSCD
jgi:hypothetical protein